MADYEPDYAVSPWETVLDSVFDWAARERPITQEIADALAALHTGVPAQFWMNLEANYRVTLARICADEGDE
jgi:plasmid maintenance system antidote protein VapI